MDYNEIKDKIGIKPYFETELGVLYNADCLDVMAKMPDKCVDLVLTDPPYGIKADKGFGGFGGFGKPIARRKYNDNWDNERPQKVIFDNMLRLSVLSIIFGGNYFADILPISTHWLVWDKLNTMPTFGDCELAYTSSNRKSVKKYTVEYNGLLGQKDIRQHPTQKPVLIMSKIISDYSKDSDIIGDFYLGSGTTAVACEQLGRKWIGIEISEKYCEIAKKRIKYESSQGKFEFTEDREATSKEVQDETLLSGSMGKPRCY